MTFIKGNKIGLGRKRPPRSDAWKEKQRLAHLGKKSTPEMIEKMRQFMKANPNSGMFQKGHLPHSAFKRSGKYTISRWHPDYKFGLNRKKDCCDICGAKENDLTRKLAFDHDHKTERFRGWLCGRCNTTLGAVGDNKELLLALIDYLTRTKKKDNFYMRDEAREGLMSGISKIATIVGKTMGTFGSNVLLEAFQSPGQYSSNDGFSIANSVKLINPLEKMGQSVLLEAINRANRSGGDGSSSTCLLTSAVIEEGMKRINEVSPMDMKRSLESCIPIIEKSLNYQKKDVTVNSVGEVARIASEDEQIGSKIQEIYQKIGKTGIINWDVSKTSEDSYTLGTGITINGASYVSPYMCDIGEDGNLSQQVRWKDAKILLYRGKIIAPTDFNNIFGTLYQDNVREVAIFCNEIDVPAITSFIITRAQRGFKSIIIKMPILWQDEWWEDISLATGATIISAASGISIQDIKSEHLGMVSHLTVTKEDTYLDGIKDLSKHISVLREGGTNNELIRAARLNTKTARYFVGGHSESAIAYRRLKLEDALGSASCALEHGIVPGGGIALLNVIESLPNTVGGKILKEALKRPFEQIVSNTGESPIEIFKRIKIQGYGFDSVTKKVVDMFDAKIVDSLDIVFGAVKNAIGVAATVLTIGTVIMLPEEESVPTSPLNR